MSIIILNYCGLDTPIKRKRFFRLDKIENYKCMMPIRNTFYKDADTLKVK